MADQPALRRVPRHSAVVRALSEASFDFEPEDCRGRDSHARGFASESVVEVVAGPPLEVTLLFSASERRSSVIRATRSVVALAAVMGIDYAGWLAREIKLRGLEQPWESKRAFGQADVSAIHLTGDAILLTIRA